MVIDFVAFSKNPSLYQNDPSYIYRCHNIAQGLKELGSTVRHGHFKQYVQFKELFNRMTPHVVVLHRPLYSYRLATWIKVIKSRGVKVVADMDDLVFHPDFSSFSPAVINNILTHQQIEQRYRKHYRALQLCDHITTSTVPLERYLRQFFPYKPITIIHNAIHHSWYKLKRESEVSAKNIISYFPGTKSHDKDFASIDRPLADFLNENSDICLLITGELDFKLKVPSDQVIYRSRVSFADYATCVASSNLNLCPLETSIFNDCKSALKVIEAGYWGIPTLSSPNPDVSRFISSGLSHVADSDTAWYQQLNKLKFQIRNPQDSHLLSLKAIQLASHTGSAELLIKALGDAS